MSIDISTMRTSSQLPIQYISVPDEPVPIH